MTMTFSELYLVCWQKIDAVGVGAFVQLKMKRKMPRRTGAPCPVTSSRGPS